MRPRDETTDPRDAMRAGYEAARAEFRTLRTHVQAIRTLFGDGLAAVLERQIETAQEKYEESIDQAERALQAADLKAEIPF